MDIPQQNELKTMDVSSRRFVINLLTCMVSVFKNPYAEQNLSVNNMPTISPIGFLRVCAPAILLNNSKNGDINESGKIELMQHSKKMFTNMYKRVLNDPPGQNNPNGVLDNETIHVYPRSWYPSVGSYIGVDKDLSHIALIGSYSMAMTGNASISTSNYSALFVAYLDTQHAILNECYKLMFKTKDATILDGPDPNATTTPTEIVQIALELKRLYKQRGSFEKIINDEVSSIRSFGQTLNPADKLSIPNMVNRFTALIIYCFRSLNEYGQDNLNVVNELLRYDASDFSALFFDDYTESFWGDMRRIDDEMNTMLQSRV